MKEGLFQAVQSFHDAFYAKDKNSFKFRLFSSFPKNCCEFSSILLALFLTKHWDDKQKIKILYGINPDDGYDRHVWLNIAGINIDITAKQFDPKLSSILITFNTYNSWHNRYYIDSENDFCLDFGSNYKESLKENMMDDYFSLEQEALIKLNQILTE